MSAKGVLRPHWADWEYCIVTVPDQTRTLNGKTFMLLREHKPDLSAAQSGGLLPEYHRQHYCLFILGIDKCERQRYTQSHWNNFCMMPVSDVEVG